MLDLRCWMKDGLKRLLKTSTPMMLQLEILQSSLMEEYSDLNLDENIRRSSLFLLRASTFTFLCFNVTLIIDGLMCLNSLEGAFAMLLRPRGEVNGSCVKSLLE